MDSALSVATTQSFIREFTAVRVELKSGSTINLIDGSGFVSFPVDGSPVNFSGIDPIFGTLASTSSIEERIADEAPRFTLSIMTPNATALGTLMQPTQQGSRVRVWWGVVNDQTGDVIGTELLWTGRLDTTKSNIGANTMIAELDTTSGFDRLFVAEEGARLNGVWHKSIWPGETGLDYVYDATSTVYWGLEAPAKSSVVYSYGSGSGSGSRYDDGSYYER